MSYQTIWKYTLWIMVIVTFVLTAIYLITFPWDTCHWTSNWKTDPINGGWSRDFDCTGRGWTLLKLWRKIFTGN